MAAQSVRKSDRIKKRKRSQFLRDGFVYGDHRDGSQIDMDVSTNISNLLDLHSKEKDCSLPKEAYKSFPNIEKSLPKHVSESGVCEETTSSNGSTQDTEYGQQGHKSRRKIHCNVCNKVFPEFAALKRHFKVHTGERPFECGQCGKTFSESCSLKRHLKIHEDERPFTCSICFKSFRDSTSFNRHQLTHGDRPRSFQCSLCDKNFTDKSGLKRHERTHSGLRPFKCDICFKTFCESGSFKRHQKIHIGVRNFHCPRCKRSFMEKQSLIRHQKTVCGFWGSNDFDESSQDPVTLSYDTSQHSIQDCSTSDINLQSDCIMSSIAPQAEFSNNYLVENALNQTSFRGQRNSSHFSTPKKVCLENISKIKSPSLGSLIQKDPILYDSISEIVQSIDSYEKMLDLCGDTGHKEIEAALTRIPVTKSESLVCFECGEALLDGKNFRSEGKNIQAEAYNSFMCITCEYKKDNDVPPIDSMEQHEKKDTISCGTKDFVKSDDCDIVNTYLPKSATSTDVRNISKLEHHQNYEEHNPMSNFEVKGPQPNVEHVTFSMTDNIMQGGENEGALQIIKPQTMPQLLLGDASQVSQNDCQNSSSGDYEAADPKIPSVFPCHLCTKVFATSSFLDQHLDLHRKSPHGCNICGKSFGTNPALKRHMRVHTGEKPYSCPYCRKKFRDPSNFCKHKKFCLSVNGSATASISIDSILAACIGTSSASLGENDKGNVNALPTDESEIARRSKVAFQSTKTTSFPVTKQIMKGCGGESLQPVMVIPALIDDDYEDDNGGVDSERDYVDQVTNCGVDAIEIKPGADYIPCELCQKLCVSEQHLKMHMNYHNGNPDVTCIECGKTFSDSHDVKKHSHVHADLRPFACEYCNRGYCDSWSLKKHKTKGCVNSELKVPTDFLHPCAICNRIFSDINYLREHMKGHKDNVKFDCDICLKTFSEAFNLRRHRRLHMSICSGCGEEFTDFNELNHHQQQCSAMTPPMHEILTDAGNKFPCPECGRSYYSLAYLERHRKFHSKVKTYECDICKKKFTEANKLRRHKRLHTGDKPFSCEECDKGFADLAHLKRHTLNSSCTITKAMRGFESFPCQFCDKVFSKNYMLVRHMNVHSQERPFSCDVCGRSYKDTSSLKRHQTIHQGVKDFVCSFCGKKFFYSDSLRRHINGKCGAKSKFRGPKSLKRLKEHRMKKDKVRNSALSDKNSKRSGLRSEGLFATTESMSNKLMHLNHLHTIPYKCKVMVDCGKVIYKPQDQTLKLLNCKPWLCRRNKHCWRCDIKTSSFSGLISHVKVHHHQNKISCSQCFAQFPCKMYWRAHLLTCSSALNKANQKSLKTRLSNISEEARCAGGLRPRRSIPRTRWSWLNMIN